MITGAKHMACGNCGNGTFMMYMMENGSLGAECRKCLSVTLIGVSTPKVVLSWGEKADGILCTMMPDSLK